MRRWFRFLLLTPIVVLSACGSSSSRSVPTATSHVAPRPGASACPADVAAGVSRLGRGHVSIHPFVAPDGAHGCRLEIPDGPVVTVTVDGAPQPYTRLERQIVETGQVFGTHRVTPAPIHVDRLGLDASWFPGLQEVLTANSRALVSVGVTWSGQPVSRRRATAVSVARRLVADL